MSDDRVLDDVIRTWRMTAHLHRFADPLDEDGRLAAEARLGRELPVELAQLYAAMDGFDGFDGSLRIDPALNAADKADDLRDSDWPIARELLVFGSDGAGDHYALWYPAAASPEDPTPVVEIGEIFEGGNMALVGTTLARFLRTFTMRRLVDSGELAAAAALGVTEAVGLSGRYAPYVKLSDPALPYPEPDPYVQRPTATRVADLVSGLARGGGAGA